MTRRMDIREMWTVFHEYYAVQAKRFENDRPSDEECLRRLNTAIVVQRAYTEALEELLDMRRRRDSVNTLFESSDDLV